MTDKPKTTAENIRALIEAHPGKLTAMDLPALLPAVVDSLGVARMVTQRQVHNQLGPMLKRTFRGMEPLLVKAEDGTLRINRPTISRATTPEEKAAAYRKSLDVQNERNRIKRAEAAGRPVSPPRVPKTPEEKEAVRLAYEAKRNAAKKAQRRERGLVPHKQRALRIVNQPRKAEISAEAAQAMNRRALGLRDMPDAGLPCTETWLAANADKIERLPSSGPRAVSPAARLRYTYG